jgi:hypothetical protein
METIQYRWNTDDRSHVFDLVFVTGTHGHPYSFGEGVGRQSVIATERFVKNDQIEQKSARQFS